MKRVVVILKVRLFTVCREDLRVYGYSYGFIYCCGEVGFEVSEWIFNKCGVRNC